MISNEEKQRIEDSFKQRCINDNIKFKSKKYYEVQNIFFSGVMTALNLVIPTWYIPIISQREIISDYGIKS
jgi:hypothetical protein